MQRYLNEMSANALHINKIGRFSCTFTEDATLRYVYSICGEHEDCLYTEKSGWEHFCTFKGVSFFRKVVPADAVKLTRQYKKKQASQEISWLNAKLGEGLSLVAKLGDEFIFERTDEKKEYEYSIKYKQKKKKKNDGQAYMPFGDISGYTFVCSAESGNHYFIKDESARHSVLQNRGKRFSDLLFSALIIAGSAIGFCASIVAMIFSLFTNNVFKTPLLILGAVGTLACTVIFGVFFKKFQRISEERRIRREEKRREAEEQPIPKVEETPEQTPIESSTGNTVVMNTVVMNNYGAGAQADTGVPTQFPSSVPQNAQMLDPNINPALDPAQNPAISALQNPTEFARAIMNSVKYGEAADTLEQGEAPEIISTIPANEQPIYLESEESEPDTPDPTDENDDDQDDKEHESFPLLKFIAFALICFASVLALVLGIRYCITWFTALGQGDALLIALSLIGIGFSPFAFRFGYLGFKELLDDHKEDE